MSAFALSHVRSQIRITKASMTTALSNLMGIVWTLWNIWLWTSHFRGCYAQGQVLPWTIPILITYLILFNFDQMVLETSCMAKLAALGLDCIVGILFALKIPLYCFAFDVSVMAFLVSQLFEKYNVCLASFILLIPQTFGGWVVWQGQGQMRDLVFLVIHLVTLYLYIIHTCSAVSEKQRYYYYTVSLCPISLPIRFILLPLLFGNFIDEWECIICHQNIEETPTLTILMLSCGHSMHTRCFNNLIKNKFIECPLCKNPLHVDLLASTWLFDNI